MRAHVQIRSALVAALVLSSVVAADDDAPGAGLPTYHSNVSEVRITFFATDEHNRTLSTLMNSDFAVVDNDMVVRNFRSFRHSEENALDVVAMVDLSESVAPRYRTAIADVLELVVREQSIPQDNISVLSFGGSFPGSSGQATAVALRPTVLCTRGCRDGDSTSRIASARSSGVTPLYDSLIFAAKFIEQRCPRDCRGDVGPDNVRSDNVRPVLILFSDGIDTMSLHSPREALAAIVASGAYVYCVDIGKSGRPGMGSGFLWRLSDATGGRYFSLSATAHDSAHGDAASILNAALDDLRASYVVTFALPTRQQGFHSVRLMPTRNLNLTFHSRNGYYYEPGLR